MKAVTERDKWYLAGDYKYLERQLKERNNKNKEKK